MEAMSTVLIKRKIKKICKSQENKSLVRNISVSVGFDLFALNLTADHCFLFVTYQSLMTNFLLLDKVTEIEQTHDSGVGCIGNDCSYCL